eukprot:gene16569-18252_t
MKVSKNRLERSGKKDQQRSKAIDDLEQYGRRLMVEVSGIPRLQNENCEELMIEIGKPQKAVTVRPVDCGFGSMIKSMTHIIQGEWLEDYQNIELWLGNSEQKIHVKQQRILISDWMGEALSYFSDDNYAKLRSCCFEKTGCLITADDSEDPKIQPEGLPNYMFSQPLQYPRRSSGVMLMVDPHMQLLSRIVTIMRNDICDINTDDPVSEETRGDKWDQKSVGEENELKLKERLVMTEMEPASRDIPTVARKDGSRRFEETGANFSILL